MFDKLQNPASKTESSEPSQLTNPGSSLDLLAEGRTLKLTVSNDSALAYLAPLHINMNAPDVKPNTDAPAVLVPGGTTADADTKERHGEVPVNKIEQPPAVSDKPPATDDKPTESSVSKFHGTIEALPASKIKDAADSIFSSIDDDYNGFLDKKELGKAVQEPWYKGQSEQVIAALYYNYNTIPNLSYDELFFENSGISPNDIAKLASIAAARQTQLDSLGNGPGWASTRFKSYDTDHDNFLSPIEIDTGLDRKTVDVAPSDHQVLTYLKNNFEPVAAAHDDKEPFYQPKEISPDDIYQHESDLLDYDGPVISFTSMINHTADMQSPNISRSLFANSENPELSVTPEAIEQGYAHDGHFLAALGTLANSDPKAIVDMINKNPNGTYTVTFPGDKTHPVTVFPPTDAELALYNAGNSSGIWASVLEKSYGAYMEIRHGHDGFTDSEGAGTDAPAVPVWSHDLDALKILTGRDGFQWESLATFSKDAITEMLLDNFKDGHGKPIEVSTSRAFIPELISGRYTEDGFVTNLDHMVTGIHPDGKDGYMVTIRSPWGFGENSPTGTKDLTIEQFQNNFQNIMFEKQ